jgi:hypothetical protein
VPTPYRCASTRYPESGREPANQAPPRRGLVRARGAACDAAL